MKALLFLLLLLPLSAAEPISVSGIPEGAVLKIAVSSSGCFHHTKSFYEIWGKRVKVWMEQVDLDGEGKAKREKVLVGEMKLSKKDIEGLDLLCDFYQSGPDGGCTTVENVEFSLVKDGKVLKKEKHVDGSCSVDEIEGVLDFNELHRMVGKAKDSKE